MEISVTKDAVKFGTSGDIGSANIMCRQNKSVDKPEESTEIDINEPVALTLPEAPVPKPADSLSFAPLPHPPHPHLLSARPPPAPDPICSSCRRRSVSPPREICKILEGVQPLNFYHLRSIANGTTESMAK